jgi:TPR repeat protein
VKRLIVALAFLASTMHAALAADAALEAFANGDFPTAKKLWEPLAAKGDPEAENGLGQISMARWMTVAGKFQEPDDNQAVLWFRKAAEQGYAPSELALGNMYLQGRGIPRDMNLAAFWIQKAAEQELPAAEFFYSKLYESGLGVPKDPEKAKYWMDKAKPAIEAAHPGFLASHPNMLRN